MKQFLVRFGALLLIALFVMSCGGEDIDDDGNDNDDDESDDDASDDDDDDDQTGPDTDESYLSYTYTFSCTDCPDSNADYSGYVTFEDSGSFESNEWAIVHCDDDSQSVSVSVSSKEYGESCSEDHVSIYIPTDIYHGPDTYSYDCQCVKNDMDDYEYECENDGYVSLSTHLLQDGVCYNTESADISNGIGKIFYGEWGPSFECYSYFDLDREWLETGSNGCSAKIITHDETKLSGTFSCHQTLEDTCRKVYKDRDTWDTKANLQVEGEFQCIF